MSQSFVGRPMEILLVEDDVEDARITTQALNQGNVRCCVSLVRDGEEAMKFIRREGFFVYAPRPDLILLDIELPKKDGHQVLAEIRADDILKDIPVIVLTASLVHKSLFDAENLPCRWLHDKAGRPGAVHPRGLVAPPVLADRVGSGHRRLRTP